VWLLAGALVSAGLAVVFRNSRDSLDDKCALLTVLPFALVLLRYVQWTGRTSSH
jgi:hypothetical protein